MKASVLLGAGWEGDSLEVLWRDAGRAFCRLWRNDTASETHAFIPIASDAEHPTLESVNRLTHEYDLQSYLDRSWAMQPLELVRERGQTMLVVDYTGGEPLDRFVRQPMEIGEFFRLAVALSGAVGRLHGRGLIHKDLKPANVLVGLLAASSGSPDSASPRDSRASASRRPPPSSSRERSPTWRQSRRAE